MAVSDLSGCVGSPVERVATAVEALEAQGLVGSTLRSSAAVYRPTPAGLEALVARGRLEAVGDGPIAVMFTDHVSSSELIESLGEAGAHVARCRHLAVLREAIAHHRGREVKSLGDGLMVVFDQPAAGLPCARAMQQAMARQGDPICLRIGIDAGKPVRQGDDYFGTTVIVAKRLCDAARGGEILISDRLRELAGPPERAGVRSRGSLALKGFTQPVAASAVPV
jgi:class 3 adenylate cyclase